MGYGPLGLQINLQGPRDSKKIFRMNSRGSHRIQARHVKCVGSAPLFGRPFFQSPPQLPIGSGTPEKALGKSLQE